MSSTNEQRKKKIVEEFFGFIMEMNPKGALVLCSKDCRQHNPYVRGGMEALFESMSQVQQQQPSYADPELSIKNVISEEDFVVAHSELLNSKSDPKKGGLRQAHIFRFGSDNKIVEYWDLTQMIDPNKMPNPANAF